MSTMKTDSYYVGLDIGTSSVGWAVTDTDLNLVKARKENFWGTRKFDEGKTAEERRLYRSSRRRSNRRKQRIALLRNLFEEELNKVDQDFINKMDDSWISKEDETRIKGADFVFDNNQKNDKKLYYSKFPTIWHLREYLVCHEDSQIDIRWIYLALHHIIKYRGNFLYTDSEFKNTESAIEEQFEVFINYLEKTYEIEMDTNIFVESVKEVLLDTNKTLAEKKDQLNSEFSQYKRIKKELTQFVNAILGYSTNFHTIFNYEDGNVKGYITEDLADDKFSDLITYLGTDEDVLEALSQIYSWSVLRKLLSDEDNQYISSEMVSQYREYGQDLADLKSLFSAYSSNNKNLFFKSDKIKKNYYHYNISKKEVSLEDLYKTIDKLLPITSEIENDLRYKRYLLRKADTTFLKVQNTTDKGAIPHQLHLIELVKIIENQSKYYPFLEEEKDKIISLLTFRIPYYVGPLNQDSEFSWVNRTSEKIYPWNFDEIVNRELSEEQFINRMIGNCTYLNNEKALPLESLLYQEYVLLNELNTVRVNNEKLDVITKNAAIEQLFKRNNSVSVSKFKDWLAIYFGENQSYEVTGLSNESKFTGSLSSWYKFTNIGFNLSDKTKFEMAEAIILWSTIFSDKNTLNARIRREYKGLTENQYKQISLLKFKGWGRLSNKLLTQLKFTLPDGSETTVIERMREKNEHFMQVINNKEEGIFQQLEEEMVNENKEDSILDQIKEIPGSPSIKKAIHQSTLLVEEITEIMGKAPEKIFLEFAREDQEKKKTMSRYNRLKEIYDQFKKEKSEYINEDVNSLFFDLKNEQARLNEEKIYLYFMQNGKCLYSGRTIEWNFLNSSDYEVDHIIPRSYTKDNSFSNKALVYRVENQRKKDSMLLEQSIIDDNYYFWIFLKKKGLMSEKKFKNLTRDHISLNAQKGFINRQLVETRQISKHVKNLLINLYPETKVQTIKSQFVSDYRKSKELYKLRSLNDYHHAHDAFLSIFLGEFIDRRMPWINNYDPLKREEYDKQVKTLFRDKRTFNKGNQYGVLELINKDSIKRNWEANIQNAKAEKYLNYKDCFVTFKVEENTGLFWKQNAKKASKGKLKPIKQSRSTEVYGGYTGMGSAYFSLVEIDNKIKPIAIPIEISNKIQNGVISLSEYIEEVEPLGIIVRERVLLNTLFEYNNHPFIVRSPSERGNAKQLLIPQTLHKLVYNAEKNKSYEDKINDFENFLNVLLYKLKSQFKELGNSNGLIQIIEDNYEALLILDDSEINHFIIETLYYFQANTQNPSYKIPAVKDLANKNRFGRMGNPITNWKGKTTIVDQSITGYYESRLRL